MSLRPGPPTGGGSCSSSSKLHATSRPACSLLAVAGAAALLLCCGVLWRSAVSCRPLEAAVDRTGLKLYLMDTALTFERRGQPQAAASLKALAADVGDVHAQYAQKLATQAKQLSRYWAEIGQLKQQVQKLNASAAAATTTAATAAAAAAAAAATAAADGSSTGGSEAEQLHLLETAGLQCSAVVKDQEFRGEELVWGAGHRTRSAAECCAACHAYTATVQRGGTAQGSNSSTCNLWAFCGDRDTCKERYGECWLRHGRAPLPPPPALPPRAGAAPGWTSGAVYADAQGLAQHRGTDLVLHTELGDIRVQLLEQQAPASVREIRRAAALHARGSAASSCSNCRIYRPEPGFLLQGVLEAPGSYVATPRHPNPPQPTTMRRGMVCWAAGGGGPHWFVNLVDQSRFSDDHLCWGSVTDMTVVDRIAGLPKHDRKPGEINELIKHVPYNISLLKAT